eukprot:scaffold26650_cov63-Phaeocystis_antarctica.AAC.3
MHIKITERSIEGHRGSAAPTDPADLAAGPVGQRESGWTTRSKAWDGRCVRILAIPSGCVSRVSRWLPCCSCKCAREEIASAIPRSERRNIRVGWVDPSAGCNVRTVRK